MKARGKREAKRSESPLVGTKRAGRGLKGRNNATVLRPFRAGPNFDSLPGATRSASLRACPWLSYSAPLALSPLAFIFRAFGAVAAGFHIPRLWRCRRWLSYSAPLALSPLAFTFSAFGAVAPGFHVQRLWRCCPWLS